MSYGGKMKTCAFFGHRDAHKTKDLETRVRERVERLIREDGVDTFLFGSRSSFDELCYTVVTALQETYPHIRRVAYLCRHEIECLVGAGMRLTKQIQEIVGKEVLVREYEEIKKSDIVNTAGKAAYVERNQWMIDESDISIFYLSDELTKQKGNSGTRLAYRYACRKGKQVYIFSE